MPPCAVSLFNKEGRGFISSAFLLCGSHRHGLGPCHLGQPWLFWPSPNWFVVSWQARPRLGTCHASYRLQKRKAAVRIYQPTTDGGEGHPTQFGFPFKFIPIISLIALFILIFVIVFIVLNFLLHIRVIIRPFILHNQVR